MEKGIIFKELDGKMSDLKSIKCTACNNNGVAHCAFPEECGAWSDLIKIENLRDQYEKIYNGEVSVFASIRFDPALCHRLFSLINSISPNPLTNTLSRRDRFFKFNKETNSWYGSVKTNFKSCSGFIELSKLINPLTQ